MQKKAIIMILSAARSGSTLLDKVIGSHSECFSLGEIGNLSDEWVKDFTLCGCGEALRECTFWDKVRSNILLKTGIDLKTEPLRFNIKPKNPYHGVGKKLYGFANLFGFGNSDYKKVVKRTKILYEIIFDISKTNFLIDSSKGISRAFMLSKNMHEYQFIFIHLVRNGKAVLNSTQKTYYKVRFKDPETGIIATRKYDAPYKITVEEVTKRWLNYNKRVLKLFKFIPRKNKHFLRHEDFITKPERILREIAEKLEIEYNPKMALLDNDHNHILGGNPSRVSADVIEPIVLKTFKNLSERDILFFEKHAGKLNQRFGYK